MVKNVLSRSVLESTAISMLKQRYKAQSILEKESEFNKIEKEEKKEDEQDEEKED